MQRINNLEPENSSDDELINTCTNQQSSSAGELISSTSTSQGPSCSVMAAQSGGYNKLRERSLASLGYTLTSSCKEGRPKESKQKQLTHNAAELAIQAGGSNQPSPNESSKEPPNSLFKKPNLYAELTKMVRLGTNTNAVITIGEFQQSVHLMVLQGYSGLFRKLGNELSMELPGEKVTPRAFKLIYSWMISDKPLQSRQGLLEIYQAAKFLEIPALVKQCEQILDTFQEASAALLYLEAKALNLEPDYRHFLTRISKFFLTLVASQEFLDLPVDSLLVLLTSDDIGVNTELEVFMAAVHWFNHQWPQRQENLEVVISNIRFGLIPPWSLSDLLLIDGSDVEVTRIAKEPVVREAIYRGIDYTSTRIFCGANREAFKQYLQATNTQPPVQRRWIYDRKCRHHHRLNCDKSLDLSYNQFVEYLNYIQMQPGDYYRSFEPLEVSNVCLSCASSSTELEDVV